MKLRDGKETVRKLLKDEYTPTEKQKLAENEDVSQYLMRQWDAVSATPDDKAAGARIWKEITRKCWTNSETSYRRRTLFIRYGAVAASLFLVGILSFWLIENTSNLYIEHYAEKGQSFSVLLPDSSLVWLNAETSIKYSKNFNKKREVILEGEAFFDVKHLNEIPFEVYFQDAVVEVKGTTFNIKTYPHTPAEISLVTGKIDFIAKSSGKLISLNPSEQIIYDINSREVIHKQTTFADFDWQKGHYRFTDKPLDELIEVVNRIYNVSINVDRKVYGKHLFNGTIKRNEPLPDVIEKLCFNLDLNYQIKEDTIIIY